MVKGLLIAALDMQKDKRKPTPPYRFSYQRAGQWYVVNGGNGFSNTHRVTEYDLAGEEWLKSIEDKEESKL